MDKLTVLIHKKLTLEELKKYRESEDGVIIRDIDYAIYSKAHEIMRKIFKNKPVYEQNIITITKYNKNVFPKPISINYMVDHRHLQILKFACDINRDSPHFNYWKQLIFIYACRKGIIPVLKYLIQHENMLCMKYEAIEYACKYNQLKVIIFLNKSGLLPTSLGQLWFELAKKYADESNDRKILEYLVANVSVVLIYGIN